MAQVTVFKQVIHKYPFIFIDGPEHLVNGMKIGGLLFKGQVLPLERIGS